MHIAVFNGRTPFFIGGNYWKVLKDVAVSPELLLVNDSGGELIPDIMEYFGGFSEEPLVHVFDIYNNFQTAQEWLTKLTQN